jgi:hypothetical protein
MTTSLESDTRVSIGNYLGPAMPYLAIHGRPKAFAATALKPLAGLA